MLTFANFLTGHMPLKALLCFSLILVNFLSIFQQSYAESSRLNATFKENLVKRNQWFTAIIYSSNGKSVISFNPVNLFFPLIKSVKVDLLNSVDQVLSVTQNMVKEYLLVWPASTWYGTTSHLKNNSFKVEIFIPPTALLGYYTLDLSNALNDHYINQKAIYVDSE